MIPTFKRGICNICVGPIDDPRKCERCTFNCCKKCIEKWFSSSSECPQCRRRNTYKDLNVTPTQGPHRFNQYLYTGEGGAATSPDGMTWTYVGNAVEESLPGNVGSPPINQSPIAADAFHHDIPQGHAGHAGSYHSNPLDLTNWTIPPITTGTITGTITGNITITGSDSITIIQNMTF